MVGEYPEYLFFAFLLLSVYIPARYFKTLSEIYMEIFFPELGYYFFLNTVINRFSNICHSVVRSIFRMMEWLFFINKFPMCDDKGGGREVKNNTIEYPVIRKISVWNYQ